MSQETQTTEEHEIIYAGEETVKVLLTRLKKVKLEREVEVGSLELQLHELQDKIHDKTSTFDHESEVIEAEIKDLMPAIAKTIKTEHGSVKWRKGSVRISYDTKSLDACMDEYVKATILPYRKETQISSSISIEVY